MTRINLVGSRATAMDDYLYWRRMILWHTPPLRSTLQYCIDALVRLGASK